MRRLLTLALALAVVALVGVVTGLKPAVGAPPSVSRLYSSVPRGGIAIPKQLMFAARLLLIPVSTSSFLDVQPAAAAMRLFPSAQQSAVDSIGSYQKPISELLDQLSVTNQPNPIGVYADMQVLKDGPEDAAVVLLNMNQYILPLQTKMATAAPTFDLPVQADKDRLLVLPSLMKGHILELTDAIKKQKAEPMRKEVEEVRETLAEFLKLSASKYEVEPYRPARQISDKELFGPLGCEFWGKKRVPGSNACAPNEEPPGRPEDKSGAALPAV